MIQVLLIEDEEPAAKRLQKLLNETTEEVNVLGIVDSIRSGKEWLQNHPEPQLILADIHLADGISFELFKQVEVKCPIIFTTAYDEYALQAFKLNSIDYLLKPIKKDELQKALQKFRKQTETQLQQLNMNQLLQAFSQSDKYRQRFVIRYGEHIKTIETKDVAYFYTEARANFLITKDAKRYVIDFNLDQLDQMLNPKQFYRINRQFIISLQSIDEMSTWTKGRVMIKLKPASKLETIVSTERSAEFKKWLSGE